MKQTLTRLGVYLLVMFCLTAIYDGWYDCGAYPLADCAVQSVAYYVVGWGFWMLVFEGVFRLASYIRRRPRVKRIFFAVVGFYMIAQTVIWLLIYIRQPERRGAVILLLSGFFAWGGYKLIQLANRKPHLTPEPDPLPHQTPGPYPLSNKLIFPQSQSTIPDPPASTLRE